MIAVENLRKGFKLYHQPADRLKEFFLRRPYHKDHQALDGISFTVQQGETLGIIGRNGAGKSTLLKILNGVLLPDTGTVASTGKVTGLLELGTGFDPNLSGVHNIRANGLLLGMSDSEITARQSDIIAFAELGAYIDEPLRTYSSGMAMRLAFAIAIHANPSTFLIDEALSVGDGHFQQKCMRRIREFRASGGAIIFVSHDLNAVKMICDRVLVLSDGRIVADGNPEDAVNHYNQLLAGDDAKTDSAPAGGYGSFLARIEAVAIRGLDSHSDTLSSGEEMLVEVDIVGNANLPALSLGLMIRDRFGQDMFGTNSHVLGQDIVLAEGERQRLRFRFAMHLAPGKYTLTLALHEGLDHTRHCYHWWDNASQFEVSGIRGPLFVGVCNLNPRLNVVSPNERDALP